MRPHIADGIRTLPLKRCAIISLTRDRGTKLRHRLPYIGTLWYIGTSNQPVSSILSYEKRTIPMMEPLSAINAPSPPLEPPGLILRCLGLHVLPNTLLKVSPICSRTWFRKVSEASGVQALPSRSEERSFGRILERHRLRVGLPGWNWLEKFCPGSRHSPLSTRRP